MGDEVFEGFVGDEKRSVLNLVLGREPVKVLENKGNVISVVGVPEETAEL